MAANGHRGMMPLQGIVADGPWHPQELPQLVPWRWCEGCHEVGPKDLEVGESMGVYWSVGGFF